MPDSGEVRLEEIEDRVILLSLAKTYKPYMDGNDGVILDIAKQAWSLGKEREARDLVDYALAVYQNIVVGVFTVNKWKKAMIDSTKWEFEGEVAPEDIKNKYLYKKIPMAFGEGQYSSHIYVNCNPN